MTRVRCRRPRTARGPFLPIEAEVHGDIRTSDYVWRLTPYLLPAPTERDADVRRRKILTARDHEIEMSARYPDGPEAA